MPTVPENAPLEARWIVAELHATAAKVNESLENYRYDEAASIIYQFFWGTFCDWYLEIVKLRLDFSETANKAKTAAALTTLVQVFEAALRLLSPFMPFLTEELWHALYDGNPPARSIALTSYPQGESRYQMDSELSAAEPVVQGWLEMQKLQPLIVDVRAQRKARGVPEKETIPLQLLVDSRVDRQIIEQNAEVVKFLAKISFIEFNTTGLDGRAGAKNGVGWTLDVVYEKQIDVQAERERLTKDIAKFEKGLAAAERQLGNEGFLAKAPANVVEGLKKQESETRLQLEKARAALDALPRAE